MALIHHLLRLVTAVLFALSGASHAAEGVSDTRILLGQSAALSGPAQELGKEMRLGAQMYFDAINAQGGVHGRTIELRSLDDGYEPDRAAANTKRLIEDEGVFALFGYVGTPTSAAALPVFTAAKVPFIGPFTGAELLRTPVNRYIFNIRASYFDETEKIVESFTSLGMQKVAVFYQNDSYGKAGLEGVERALAKRSLKIVATGTVERNTVAVDAAVEAIAAAHPDIVVMISAYKSCAAFIKAMRQAGNTAMFYNVSFVGSRALAAELGSDGVGVGISQVVPFPWATSVPIVREYRKAVQRIGAPESFTSLEGYIAARVMVEALRRAGRELSREKLIAALEGLEHYDVGGYTVDFSARSRSGSKFVELTIIGNDGKFKH